MKKYFAETNDYNVFIVTDGERAVAFDCETLEEAKKMDCSGIECETDIESVAHLCNKEGEIFNFNEDDFEELTFLGEL